MSDDKPLKAPPKVFISYSWTSPEHADWVLGLAERLRRDGSVETILDRWHLKPGQDKYKFMEQTVTDPTIQKVLMICDRRYAEKADNRQGGVGDETQIISSEIYSSVDQKKFVPVIAERDADGQPYKPAYIKSRLHIDLSDPLTFEQGYEDLLRDIHDKPVHTPPPLGPMPSFLLDDEAVPLQTTYKFRAFRSAILNGKPMATGLAEDYLRQLEKDLEGYNLGNRPSAAPLFKENVLASIADSLAHRDEFIDFLVLVSRYTDPRLSAGIFTAIQRFFAATVRFIAPQRDGNDHPSQPFRLIIPELFLYTQAVFFAYEHYSAAAGLLSRTYTMGDPADQSQRSGVYDYVIFQPYVPILHVGSNSHWSFEAGPTATLLVQRATHPEVSKGQLLDADYVLYARTVFSPGQTFRQDWICSTRAYLAYVEGGMPFFLKARSRPIFAAAKEVLGVASKDDLMRRFDERTSLIRQESTARYVNDPSELDRRLMNLERLDTQ